MSAFPIIFSGRRMFIHASQGILLLDKYPEKVDCAIRVLSLVLVVANAIVIQVQWLLL